MYYAELCFIVLFIITVSHLDLWLAYRLIEIINQVYS